MECPVSPVDVSRKASNDPCQLSAKGLVRLCFLHTLKFHCLLLRTWILILIKKQRAWYGAVKNDSSISGDGGGLNSLI